MGMLAQSLQNGVYDFFRMKGRGGADVVCQPVFSVELRPGVFGIGNAVGIQQEQGTVLQGIFVFVV